MSLSDLRSKTDKLVKRQGTVTIADAELDQALDFGVRLFSQWSPRHRVTEFAGSGSALATLPSDYYWETSAVEWVEYPIDSSPPTFLVAGEDYILQRTSSTNSIHFLRAEPDTDESVRMAYTTLHTLNGSVDTIPVPLADALVYLAGMSIAESLASYYLREQDSTLEADIVNFDSRAANWMNLSRRWERRAKTILGMEEDETMPAAMSTGDFDVLTSQRRSFLTHPRTMR